MFQKNISESKHESGNNTQTLWELGELSGRESEMFVKISLIEGNESLNWMAEGTEMKTQRYCASRIYGTGEFTGGPVVRTSCFNCHHPGFNPWLGN